MLGILIGPTFQFRVKQDTCRAKHFGYFRDRITYFIGIHQDRGAFGTSLLGRCQAPRVF